MHEKALIDEERFLNELAEYMNKRYEATFRAAFTTGFTFYRYAQDFPLVRCLDGRKRRLKWSIVHKNTSTSTMIPRIEEYLNGKICVSSGYILQDVFLDTNPIKFVGTSITEKEDIARKIRSGGKQQELKLKYPGLVGEFIYGNSIAKEVSQKTGVEVKYLFPSTYPFSTFFYSIFNSKKMNYEDKARIIKIMLNAIDMAFEKAWDLDKLYDFFVEHGYRERREYLSFEEESEYLGPRYGAIRFTESDKNRYYIGLRDGRLITFYRNKGIQWIFITHGTFYPQSYLIGTKPLIISENGTLYFFNSESYTDHYFYALNQDGALKWMFKIKSLNTTDIKTPLFSNSIIYLTLRETISDEICVYALSYDGALKWIFKTKGTILVNPTVDSDGTLYFMSYESGRSYVYALGADGNLKWKFEAEGSPAISPIAIGPDGAVYFQTIIERKFLSYQKDEYTSLIKYCIYVLEPDGSLRLKRYEDRPITISTKIQKHNPTKNEDTSYTV